MKESQEHYLETIFIMSKTYSKVRTTDVANYLGYSKASVSRAMKLLKEKGLVDDDNGITLTQAGEKMAKSIYKKHTIIMDFLMLTLGLDEKTAEKDACRMEHVLSEKTIQLMYKKIGEEK